MVGLDWRRSAERWVVPGAAIPVFGSPRTMRIPFLGLALLACSSGAFALQPMAFPMRSQNGAQQSIDTAMCYAAANQQTGVSMAKFSQAPEKAKIVKVGAVRQVAVADPLPAGMAPGPAAPVGASFVAVSLAMPSGSGKGGKPAAGSASPASPDVPMMPALPPPESPMVSYWSAFSGCMTQRGYMVR